jgi:hypothetical protein
MSTEIMLPWGAVQCASNSLSYPVIQVVDDRTNIAAADNLKSARQQMKEFEALCEPMRVELRKPLDAFLAEKKKYSDQYEAYERAQKQSIGAYSKKVMDEENARRKADADNPVMIEQAKARSEYAQSTSKLKAYGVITDRMAFIAALAESGNVGWLNLIFEKYNESKLNDFLKSAGIDGDKTTFPGVSVELRADVKVR